MSDKKAKDLVAKIIALLRPTALRAWSHDPELKKGSKHDLHSIEEALLAIAKPLLKNKFQEAADAAQEYATLLGSLGTPFLLETVSQLEVSGLDEVRPSLVWSAAWSYQSAGDLTSAHDRFVRARHLASAKGQIALAARIAIDLGVIAYNRDDVKNARYWYETARQEARLAKDRIVEAIAIHNLAVRKMEHDPVVARRLLEKSLRMKEAAGAADDSLAGNWTNLGILFAEAGKHERSYGLFRKAVETYRAFRDYPNLALALLNLGNASSELGHFNSASSLYREGLRIAKRLADVHTEKLLHQGYASNAFKHSRFSVAATEFRALHDSLIKLGEIDDAIIAMHDLALCTARAGDLAEGRKIADQALMLFKESGAWDWYRRCLLMIATEMEEASSDGRLAVLREAADLNGGQDIGLKLQALRSLWHELLERGLYKEASHQLHREKSLLKDDSSQLKERLHHAGMKLLNCGRKKEALRLLKQVDKLSKEGGKVEVAKVRQDLAIVLAENMNFKEAFPLLEKNRDLFSLPFCLQFGFLLDQPLDA